MKASYCIEGRIHNHKLMDTIIVMGSANIRHNNENEKRFFFLLSSSYFAFYAWNKKIYWFVKKSQCSKMNKKVPFRNHNCEALRLFGLWNIGNKISAERFEWLLNSILWECIEGKSMTLSRAISKNYYNQFVCKISPLWNKHLYLGNKCVVQFYFCPSLKDKMLSSLGYWVVFRDPSSAYT